ncbi:hypothetical protein D3C73_1281250 [compost metagenome]
MIIESEKFKKAEHFCKLRNITPSCYSRYKKNIVMVIKEIVVEMYPKKDIVIRDNISFAIRHKYDHSNILRV